MITFGTTEHEQDLFFEALEQADPVARTAVLERACVGKPALRAQMERLLAIQAEAERFFAEAERATYMGIKARQEE